MQYDNRNFRRIIFEIRIFMSVTYMFIEFLATIFINARSMLSKHKVKKKKKSMEERSTEVQ